MPITLVNACSAQFWHAVYTTANKLQLPPAALECVTTFGPTAVAHAQHAAGTRVRPSDVLRAPLGYVADGTSSTLAFMLRDVYQDSADDVLQGSDAMREAMQLPELDVQHTSVDQEWRQTLVQRWAHTLEVAMLKSSRLE